MKDNLPNAKLMPVLDNSGDNFVGGSDMKKNRSNAIKILPAAKNVEIERLNLGWVWVHKPKESKLVHPNKVKSLLKEGWSRLKNTKN